jgi:hypothetical protein
MFVAVPIVRNFREYNEQEVGDRVAVDRYIAKLEREEFFVPRAALVR